MAKSDDKSDDKNCSENENQNLKHNISINMCEVERAFKRLRVEESDDSHSKSGHHFNHFSLKSSTPSPRKSSSQDKRQSINGFRRRIPSLSSNKEKSSSKDTTLEDDYEFGAKSKNICKDFSQINSITCERTQSSSQFCFTNHSKSLSDWRTNNDNDCTQNAIKLNKLSLKEEKTCARQALCDTTSDASVDELAAYFDDNLYLPRKMSFMAEMMYT